MTPSIVPTINCEQIASVVRTWLPTHLESREAGPDVWVFTPNEWAERGEDPEPGAVCYVRYHDQEFRNLVECDSPKFDQWERLLRKDGLWFEVVNASEAYLYPDTEVAGGTTPNAPRSGKTVIDYSRLEQDLRAAKEVAESTECPDGDGGTCNSDSLLLTIARAKMERVKEIAERVGLVCSVRRGHTLIFSPPRLAQGFDRTFQVKAMAKVLEERGWEAEIWSQID